MDSKNIQKELVKLEKELADLKTIQGVIPSLRGYTYNYYHTGSGQQQVNQLIEVTYEAGDGVIFSGCLNLDYIGTLDIQNNKQRFFFRILFSGTTLTFYSNRKILSVENVSE